LSLLSSILAKIDISFSLQCESKSALALSWALLSSSSFASLAFRFSLVKKFSSSGKKGMKTSLLAIKNSFLLCTASSVSRRT